MSYIWKNYAFFALCCTAFRIIIGLRSHLLNIVLVFFVVLHLGSILFGLLHAVWGQYFYFPFLVENTELHIGPRPKIVFIAVVKPHGKMRNKQIPSVNLQNYGMVGLEVERERIGLVGHSNNACIVVILAWTQACQGFVRSNFLE